MLDRMLNLTQKGKKDLKTAIFFCVITNISLFLPFIILVLIMQTVINPLITGQALDTGMLWQLCGFGVLAAALYTLIYSVEYDKTFTTAYKECTNIRVEVAERMRKLPLSFFNRKDLSELTTNIMGDCETTEQMMSHTVPQIVANCISIQLAGIMLSVYDWRMALALICVLPVSVLIICLSKRIQTKFGERHVQAKLDVSGQVQEYLDGIKVVKAFGLAGEKSVALKGALKTMMREAMVFESVAGSFATLAMTFLQVGIGLVILVGVNLLTTGETSMIPFLTFAMISARIYAPVITIMTMLPELFYLLTSTKRMQALRKEPVMTGDEHAVLSSTEIEFDNVTFAYGEDDVIKNVSVKIPNNGVTALVGPSGSGKSTMSRLIARFWDVNSGKIKIGDKNIKDIEPERLMSYMSFVFQDVVLFNDTVKNNIRIGKQDATDEEVYRAAKIARCDEFINKMSNGYHSMIGENGCTLSGGERQRISIARALLKDAPIVLLDEATASLDPENEVLIQEAISELVKDRTVIVIAHRLKTVKGAEKIIVLDGGSITEQGTHHELIAKRGLYAKLWNIQHESLGWSV